MNNINEFQPITSLLREQLKVKKNSKINIDPKDSVYKIVQKLSNFVYKNSESITKEEICSSLSLSTDLVVHPISLEDSGLNFERAKKELSGFREMFSENNFELFEGIKSEGGGRKTIFIVSDDVPFSKHNAKWSVCRSFDTKVFPDLQTISKSKLSGLSKIFNLVVSQYVKDMAKYKMGTGKHPGFSTKDLIFSFFKIFSNSKYGSKKRKFYFSELDLFGIVKEYMFGNEKDINLLKKEHSLTMNFENENTDERKLCISNGAYSVTISDSMLKSTVSGEFVTSWSKEFAFKYIKQYLLKLYKEDINVSLMNRYSKTSNSNYAKTFETKKNIPLKIQLAMNSSHFLNTFRFVEYDESIDVNKMSKLEDEWKYFSKVLPKPKNKQIAELRFRYLGHHNTSEFRVSGLFFPYFNTIALDPREVNDGALGTISFVHEYGHFLDYNHTQNEPLSLSEGFSSILDYYQRKYDKMSIMPTKASYFKTPTEVFARSFEVYFDQFNNVKSSFNKSELKSAEYIPLLEIVPEINKYFNMLFPNLFEALSNYSVPLISETKKEPNTELKTAINIDNAIETCHEQLSLFEM
ncbi:LPD1 domain-containing protein [Lactococcus lactis]|uniref:LPD1 domain-containing protein n=1 Tax=Lactococcus lactis TaxID=1358 RepID=UPI00288D6CFC|nr:LPD1 domain-containing protein [Lactococcus lactis]MDT2909291.1 hypothetical protein [Lactococcus lactis]MDT2925179.1 hypothetical protein [Lactococcus lactis]MDT2952038.1 hypothetical protein [Lactococcus lactis]